VEGPVSLVLSQSDVWRELHDPVRGRRRFRFDDDGRPCEGWLAGGEHVVFTRDADGKLRRIDDDGGPFLTIDPIDGGTRLLRRGAPATELRVEGEARELRSGGALLRIEPSRVIVPGLAEPLDYEWSEDGGCAISMDGVPLLTMTLTARAWRFEVHGVGAWEEGAPILGASTITIGALRCTIARDALQRTTGRRWSDGREESWSRDERGRLAFAYSPNGDLLSDRVVDDAHRVTSYRGVAYRYDEAGRRIERIANGVVTRYEYDLLGQLTRAGDIRCTYDGLGRRVSVSSPERTVYEHRDDAGRLWSVTDANGRLLHAFLWLGGRMLARLDHGVASEGYVCDGSGTLLAVLRAGREPERVDAPPFGAISGPYRPTLYGHVGDPRTGLIHFGARELDPELGLFLTPDPWDGAPDDPRLWDGGDAAMIDRAAELPRINIHPYALCHHDPLGRVDLDGHNTFLNTLLGVTWGMPLTSLSLFAFLPLNIVTELIVNLFIGGAEIFGVLSLRDAYKDYRIFDSYGGLRSKRQGLISLSLNGFFIRVFASGITIGQVVQAARSLWDFYDFPRMLEIWDIAGSGALAAFNDSAAKQSVVAIKATKSGASRLHVSAWSRGFGNEVKTVFGGQKFTDRALPGETFARGIMHLARPAPPGFPTGTSAAMQVDEYLAAVSPAVSARAVLDEAVAIRVKTDLKTAAGDFLEVSTKNQPAEIMEVKEVVHEVVEGKFFRSRETDLLMLDRLLPAALKTAKLRVRRLTRAQGAIESTGWQGGPRELTLAKLDVLPNVAKGGLVRVARVDRTSFAPVDRIELKLNLSPTLGAQVADATTVTVLRAEKSFSGSVKVPTKPEVITLGAKRPKVDVGDLLLATISGGKKHVRVKAVQGEVIEVTPSLEDLNLAILGETPVSLQRWVDVDPKKELAKITTVAGDVLTVAPPRASLFKKGSLVAFTSGGDRLFREVASITDIKLVLAADAPGAAPFGITPAEYDGDYDVTGIRAAEQKRFLKWISGNKPADFGDFPAAVMAVRPRRRPGVDPREEEVFYIKGPNAAPALHPTWKPRDDFWILDTDLPLEGDAKKSWRLDVERAPEFFGAVRFDLVEYAKDPAAPASRVDGTPAGAKLALHAPRVHVPVKPAVTSTHLEAVFEHELHHVRQMSRWGPIMAALPLTAIAFDIDAGVAANGGTRPRWLSSLLDPINQDLFGDVARGDLYTIGGILQTLWNLAIPGTLDYETWHAIFNPVSDLLLRLVPEVEADDSGRTKALKATARILGNFFELRSWNPLLGFFLLGTVGGGMDGKRNFLEQQASRASGEMYSPTVSADDHFNADYVTYFKGHTLREGNLTKSVGSATRMLMFAGYTTDTLLSLTHADQPRTPTVYHQVGEPTIEQLLAITARTANMLFSTELYDYVDGPLPGILSILPPKSLAGAPPADFWLVGARTRLVPHPRAHVPLPPQVNRTVGFYLIPGGPGTCEVALPETRANTHLVTLTTTEGRVTLGGTDVAWHEPVPAGGAINVLPKLTLFITESAPLRIAGQGNQGWDAEVDPAADFTLAADGTKGWIVRATKTFAAGVQARIRLFRIFRKNDPAFDLRFDDVPTLKNVASYLDNPAWIVVRDFLVELADIQLKNDTATNAAPYELTTPIPAASVVAVPALPTQPAGPAGRGQKWKIGPPPAAVPAGTVFRVTATFGTGADTAQRSFDLTYTA
jgi:YD repeat-containing protein